MCEEYLVKSARVSCGDEIAADEDGVCFVSQTKTGVAEKERGKNVAMIDTNDSRNPIDPAEFILPPPRFDERAAANAQAVQPIPTERSSSAVNRISSLGRALTTGSRALVIVVIAGLAAGTLGGMAWVKDGQVTEGPPTRNESASEIGSANGQNEQVRGVVFGVATLQSTGTINDQNRKVRSRMKSSRAPRAYRVATLR